MLRCLQAKKIRQEVDFEGVKVNIIALDDLIANKKASGKLQDRVDTEKLEKLKTKRKNKRPGLTPGTTVSTPPHRKAKA